MRDPLTYSTPLKDIGNILHHSLSFTQGDHLCQFYQNESMLMESLASFVVPGLTRGDGVVIVATKENVKAFKEFLERRQIDVTRVISNEQLLILDAHETLSMFIVDGLPDRALFNATIPPVIKNMLAKFPKVRAYGEMVNILFHDQNYQATRMLEELWNELARTEPFSLMCGYSICEGHHHENLSQKLEEICEPHTHLISNFGTLFTRH